ncbi:hypothetical protein MTQ01_05075 [Streptomyces sp. XM4193]|uniref:hypothetical protein n=1 Tax=Streptomyces sp. XM4193 TaxID=2929782 RepID=UPI001FFABC49|nr:hypothetical protein [Streptomyces sp. XM4193]MCK1795390.1 hypothetical protein [Streptomyces sp. XM4193]
MVTAAQPGPAATRARPESAPPPSPETAQGPGPHPVEDPVGPSAPLGVRNWRWDEPARARTAGVTALALGLVAAWYAHHWLGSARAGTVLLVVACLAGAAGSVLGGLADGARAGDRHRLGYVLLALAGLWGVCGAWVATGTLAVRLAAFASAVALTLVLAGVSTPLGRSALLGAGAVAATAALWETGLLLTDARGTGVVLGALSVFVLGFLPRLALQGAGLLRLDDQRARGTSVSAHEVDTALADNHRQLALVTMTAAASTAAGGWLALERPSPWSVGLVVLLAVLLLARARAYPLTVEVLALTAAAAVLLVRLVVLWGSHATVGPLALFAVLLGGVLMTLVVRVPERTGGMLRRVTDVGESVSVVLLLPFVVGAFGVFGQLLTAF